MATRGATPPFWPSWSCLDREGLVVQLVAAIVRRAADTRSTSSRWSWTCWSPSTASTACTPAFTESGENGSIQPQLITPPTLMPQSSIRECRDTSKIIEPPTYGEDPHLIPGWRRSPRRRDLPLYVRPGIREFSGLAEDAVALFRKPLDRRPAWRSCAHEAVTDSLRSCQMDVFMVPPWWTGCRRCRRARSRPDPRRWGWGFTSRWPGRRQGRARVWDILLGQRTGPDAWAGRLARVQSRLGLLRGLHG